MKKIKINTGGVHDTIEYKCENTFDSAPEIVRKFVDKDGLDWYELDNGRSQLVEKYNALWFPQKRRVMPLHYKGENKDKTKISK